MSDVLPSGRGRFALQFCAAASIAAIMGGCSTDASRLSDPFTNPFSSASNEPVSSTPSRVHGTALGRSPPVVSQALPPRSNAVASVEPLRPRLTTASNAPISRETTGSIEPAPVRTAAGASYGGWTSSGGVAVTVGEGDTAETLSKRYGVPPAALLQTNGYRTAAEVRPGQRMTIPVYNAVAAAQHAAPPAPVAYKAEPKPARVAMAAPTPRDPPPEPKRFAAKAALLKAKPEHVAAATKPVAPAKPAAEPAKPARVAAVVLKDEPKLKPAPKLVALPQKTADARVAAVPAKAAPKAAPVRTASLAPTAVGASPEPVAALPVKSAPAQAAPRQPDPAPTASIAPAAEASPVASASGNPEFRWPARGRIIQGFKGGSSGNDGINIAVPEGTAVKAAETGTVAYAGSELKGYGNLVLIRHPNGFVTAYANNGEIDVKRGDQVKRGQTIAKSGQSGNVSSPQLHFELRKGATPVDPTSYLAGL